MIKVTKIPYDGTFLQNEQAVKQIVRMRLEMVLGDVFYARNLGSEIQALHFEANDVIVENLASIYVRDALSDISYITIKDIRTKRDNENLFLQVIWQFNASKNNYETTLTITD